MDKLQFLKNEFPKLLRTIDPNAKGAWGVLNGQQMVEHMAESISFATGKSKQALHTPAEQVEKFKAFALSDKEFRPNTKNVLMSDVPAPTRKANMEEAVNAVEQELADFETYFNNNKGATLMNSIFGELNFQEWTILLHKHAVHHLKQFGKL